MRHLPVDGYFFGNKFFQLLPVLAAGVLQPYRADVCADGIDNFTALPDSNFTACAAYVDDAAVLPAQCAGQPEFGFLLPCNDVHFDAAQILDKPYKISAVFAAPHRRRGECVQPFGAFAFGFLRKTGNCRSCALHCLPRKFSCKSQAFRQTRSIHFLA